MVFENKTRNLNSFSMCTEWTCWSWQGLVCLGPLCYHNSDWMEAWQQPRAQTELVYNSLVLLGSGQSTDGIIYILYFCRSNFRIASLRYDLAKATFLVIYFI